MLWSVAAIWREIVKRTEKKDGHNRLTNDSRFAQEAVAMRIFR